MAKQQKESSYRIEWTASANKNFFKAIDYISEFSLQGAESVMHSIAEQLQKAAEYPQIFSPDKWKKNNAGIYRAFEIKRFRITYKILSSEKVIKVIHFRHTKQNSTFY